MVSCIIEYRELAYLQIVICIFGFRPTPNTNHNLLIFTRGSRNKECRSLLLKQRRDMLFQSQTKFLLLWYWDCIEPYEINSGLGCCRGPRENEMVTSLSVSNWLSKYLLASYQAKSVFSGLISSPKAGLMLWYCSPISHQQPHYCIVVKVNWTYPVQRHPFLQHSSNPQSILRYPVDRFSFHKVIDEK